MEQINWLAIVLSTITPMFIGYIYYHPKVMGSAWMKTLGLTEEDLNKGNMALTFGLSFVMALLMTMFLLLFNNGEGQEGQYDTFLHGAWHGLFVGVLIAVPVLVSNSLFQRMSLRNILINAIYWLITLAVMGGVVDALTHW